MSEIKKDIFKILKFSLCIFACLLILAVVLAVFGITFAESFIFELLVILCFCVSLFLFKAVSKNLHLKSKKMFVFLSTIGVLGVISLFVGLATIDYVFVNCLLSNSTCLVLMGLFVLAVLIKFSLHNKKIKNEKQLIYEWRNISK